IQEDRSAGPNGQGSPVPRASNQLAPCAHRSVCQPRRKRTLLSADDFHRQLRYGDSPLGGRHPADGDDARCRPRGHCHLLRRPARRSVHFMEGRGNDCADLRDPRLPLMALVGTASPPLVIIGIGVGIGLLGLPYGALGSMMAEMFPDRSRYTAVAVSYNFSGAIGGFAPSVALASVTVFGGTIWATAVLLARSMLITAAGGVLAGRAAHNDALMY